jgi:hypothetical protein
MVQAGGVLVYGVHARQVETDDVVAGFASHPEFALEPAGSACQAPPACS